MDGFCVIIITECFLTEDHWPKDMFDGLNPGYYKERLYNKIFLFIVFACL